MSDAMSTELPLLISIVTPCFNEEDNVVELTQRIRAEMAKFPHYRYEHIFIDNASSDRTVSLILELAAADRRIKLIVNQRNFGQIRSPTYGVLCGRGAAIIQMASDLQDPPELIGEFITRWEAGHRIVIAQKASTAETLGMSIVRKLYYGTIGRISDVKLIPDFTGFGLYDRSVVDALRALDDPYPYFRGMIAELGFEYATVLFDKPQRKRGITKNNFYTLFDMAMLGITSHSKVPIRLATMLGFALSVISLLVSVTYLVLKLIYWEHFIVGTAPILISLFFFASVQLFFIGVIGEYVASIHTQVMKRPLVTEKRRVNFEFD